jgi:hypothetical protein
VVAELLLDVQRAEAIDAEITAVRPRLSRIELAEFHEAGAWYADGVRSADGRGDARLLGCVLAMRTSRTTAARQLTRWQPTNASPACRHQSAWFQLDVEELFARQAMTERARRSGRLNAALTA